MKRSHNLWRALDRIPLGRAVLGKCVADTIVVRTPEGQRRYEILGVRYT